MFKAGERVFVPGSSGEPAGAMALAVATPGVSVLTSFVPGVNDLPLGWAEDVTVSGPFAFPGSGYGHLPSSYAALAADLAATSDLDAVVVQVCQPDRHGRASLGPAVEFSTLALDRARRRIAVVNAATPRFRASLSVQIADFDLVIEGDAPLPAYDPGHADEKALRIGARIAAYIEDGVTLQTGLGRIPAGLMTRLTDRRDLRLHSGMVSDGVDALAAAGALSTTAQHRTTVFLGSRRLYDWAADQDLIRVEGCEHIHAPLVLAAIERLVAINSALEVDLLGQCNLEAANGRQVSGGGGATDFARAARLSPGGLSIVALPAATGAGRSRIVPRLGADSLVTLGRNDIDLVITEHGVADLRGRPVQARAEQLISIAEPSARGALQDGWRDIARKLGI